MRNRLLSSLLLAALVSTGPLAAGVVYVPVASNEVVEGEIVETRVWISNPTGQAREFRSLFLPSSTDGTVSDRAELLPRSVPPRETLILDGEAIPIGEMGMLEIDADPELVVSAEIQRKAGDLLLTAARMPLVSSDNLIPGGQTAHLQGLERSLAGTVSNVGIINLSQETAGCTVRAFDAGGFQIQGTFLLSLGPLLHVQFDEALAILGFQETSNVRLEVSCPDRFYAYATVFGVEPDQTLFIQPSESGDSQLLVPGAEPPVIEFREGGNFLVATEAQPYRLFKLPAEPNQLLVRAEIEFDFVLGRFHSDLFHTLTSLRSGGIYFVVAIRGDNARTIFDTPGETARAIGPWRAGGRYHVSIIYDVALDLAVLQVSEAGSVVHRMVANANRDVLAALDGSLRLDFSQTKVFDNAYFPLWGSTFSNLEVRLYPAQ